MKTLCNALLLIFFMACAFYLGWHVCTAVQKAHTPFSKIANEISKAAGGDDGR